jgi:Ran GTPase-activating protein 1
MTAWAKAYSLLSQGLNKASQLEVLNLQDNTFTLPGAKALAGAIPGWKDLQELGVSDCLLTGKGGVLVSEALAKGENKKLEILRLQYNDITAKGLKSLADTAAGSLPALKKVEVNGNKFAEEDPAVIALQELFEERKEQFGGDVVLEDDWGLDELDELDDEEEEEEEEEEGVPEPEELAEKLIKEAEEAQEEPTVQLKDKEVEELAKKLEKTSI